jgi:hypothetical protein
VIGGVACLLGTGAVAAVKSFRNYISPLHEDALKTATEQPVEA